MATFSGTSGSDYYLGIATADTIYDFVHYHSQVHEVLGVAKGGAVIECGGIRGLSDAP